MPTSLFAAAFAPLLVGLSGRLYAHRNDGLFMLPLLPKDGQRAPSFRARRATSAHQALHNRTLEARLNAALAQDLLPVQALLAYTFGHTLVTPIVRTRHHRRADATTWPYFELHVQGFCLVVPFRENAPTFPAETLTSVLDRLHTTLRKSGDPRSFPENEALQHKHWSCLQPGINAADRKRIHTSTAAAITRLHRQIRNAA